MRHLIKVVSRRKNKRHSNVLRFSSFFLIWSISFAIFEYFVPLYLDSLEIDYFMIGLIISGASFVSFFVDPFLGYLQRRFPPKTLLAASCLLFCLNIILFLHSGNIIFLLFLASNLYGIAFDLFNITTYKSIFDNSVERDRSTNVSFLDSVNNLGLLIGAVVAGFIVSSNLEYAPYLCIAILLLLSIVVFFATKDSFKRPKREKKLNFSVGYKEIYHELRSMGRKGLFLILLLVFLYLWDGFFFVFEPLFTQKFHSYAVSEEILGGFLMAIYMLPVILFESRFGKLEDKYGRKRFIFCGFVISAIFVFLLQSTDSLILTAISVFFVNFGFAAVAMPAIEGMYESVTEKKFGNRYRGISVSIMEIALSIGFLVGPLVGGFFISLPGGFDLAFRIFGFLTLGMLLLSWWMLREKKESWWHMLFFGKQQKEGAVVYAKATKKGR